MAKVNSNSFRIDRARELRQIASILERTLVCVDVSAINSVIEHCKSNCPSGVDSWGYDISKLIFRIDNQKHTQPKDILGLDLELSVSLTGTCHNEDYDVDSIRSLAVDFVISGKRASGGSCYCSWHHDRHIDGDEDPQFAHPHYHFQHGGNKMWGDVDFGEALVFESPRIAHPPLDGILAIDYVVSNFCGNKWRKLLEDGEYVNLVENAQKRLWRPYAISTASKWCPDLSKSWLPQNLWPQLIM